MDKLQPNAYKQNCAIRQAKVAGTLKSSSQHANVQTDQTKIANYNKK